jgi:hypothetical protein
VFADTWDGSGTHRRRDRVAMAPAPRTAGAVIDEG